MNGYFQLLTDSKGVSLVLVPPTEEGETIRVNELKAYLDKVGVKYDPMAINSALHGLGEEKIVIFLSSESIPPVPEKCEINVSLDKLSGSMRLFPASEGGKELSLEEVLDDIKFAKIKYGINEVEIQKVLLNKIYCTDIIIAKGKLPTAGVDATIKYNFDTNNKARPELKEDGTVDFFKLNTLHHCTKGMVLAEITPKIQGEDGVDVFGNVNKARIAKDQKFNHGKNLEISEDGLQLISLVDGHASLVNGAVFVADVYEVENVDTSTGNIEYNGNVMVKGNVCENFSVKTEGNVFINGVVEGATIEAGGDITIARGMHGQGKGSLKAGGKIVSKFISAAKVTATGLIESEQILNSEVTSGEEVHAEAGKGLINGGKIVATHTVSAKNIGSAMGGTTVIEVGGNPQSKMKLVSLEKSVQEKSKALTQIQTILTTTAKKVQEGAKLNAEQVMQFKKLQETYKLQKASLDEDVNEINRMHQEELFDEKANIRVNGTMYSGVAVTVAGVSMAIKSDSSHCKFVKDGADIKSLPI